MRRTRATRHAQSTKKRTSEEGGRERNWRPRRVQRTKKKEGAAAKHACGAPRWIESILSHKTKKNKDTHKCSGRKIGGRKKNSASFSVPSFLPSFLHFCLSVCLSIFFFLSFFLSFLLSFFPSLFSKIPSFRFRFLQTCGYLRGSN